MTDQVEEVKQKTDIVAIISEYVDLKKAGSNFKGLCPFHSEKTPSFMVSPELQIFKCFGCGKSGDVFTFLEEYDGMEFYEALKVLSDRAGIKLKVTNFERRSIKDRYYQINSWVSHFYHFVLLKHPKGRSALNYLLKERELKIETIKKFQLGYSPNIPLALKSYVVDKKKVTFEELNTLGVIYKRGSQNFDRFRGRVVFPLHDHRDNVIGFAGRIMPEDGGKDLAKYINTPETPIYHKSQTLYGLNQTKGDIKRKKEAIVVEGELDMLSSWQSGIKNTIAIKGSALTEEQVKLLGRYCKTLILALDSDIAGNEAAKKGIFIAQKEGFEVKVVTLGEYKDPDDMARNDPKGLKKAIKKAVNVWDFLINFSISKYGNDTGTGKAKVSKELVPILSGIEDKIVQSHYTGVLARKLKVSEDAVIDEVNRFSRGRKNVKGESEATKKADKKNRRETLEERLLTVSFKLDPLLLVKKVGKRTFETSFTKRLIEEFYKYQGKKKSFDLAKFKKALPEELSDRFVNIILSEVEGVDDENVVKLQKEFDLVIKELKILSAKEKLKEVGETISQLEEKKEKNKLKKAQQKFAKISEELASLEEND